MSMSNTEEIDGINVPGVGEAILSVREEDGVSTWLAVFVPAVGERVALEVSKDENDVRMAFAGARIVLDTIEKSQATK